MEKAGREEEATGAAGHPRSQRSPPAPKGDWDGNEDGNGDGNGDRDTPPPPQRYLEPCTGRAGSSQGGREGGG